MSPKSFQAAVLVLLNQFSKKHQGTLEEYLRSLWVIVNRNQYDRPTYDFFLTILEQAFQTAPAEFDTRWLEYDKPLSWNYIDNGYVIEALKNKKSVIIERNVDDFRILKHTLLFQIADLYRMRENQLKNPQRYFGVKSPSGYSWYKFDIFTYLECATRGIVDHSRDERNKEVASCDWVDLATILELGRLYE